MIEMLIELPAIKNIQIEKFYHGKDDDLAMKIYKKTLDLNDETSNQKVNLLINALFKACHKSATYLNILIEMSRNFYKLRKFTKCLETCNYLENLDNFPSETDVFEEYKIESLLIKSECYKKLHLNENSKLCLNDSMRKVNEFITKKCGSECEDFKKEKISFLKPILERLNLMKSSDETNKIENEISLQKVHLFSFFNDNYFFM